MNLPQVIEIRGIRVLTTRQLAAAYGTDVKVIQNNFQRNKDRYTVGKHYIYMDRDELREVKATYPQFEGELNRTSRANFWTEKGALLHAKSLNTDKAWEVYDYLVDFYFRVKEEQQPPRELTYREKREAALAEARAKAEAKRKELNLPAMPSKPCVQKVVDIPENPRAQDAIRDLKKALNAVEVMVDESNRYVSEEKFKRYADGITDTVAAVMARASLYLHIQPKLIEKQY